jgi:predicted nucleic acid-binding protein
MKRPRAVYLDANVIIHIVEGHPSFSNVLKRFLNAIESQHVQAHTSEISWAEVMVVPIRVNDQQRLAQFEALLSTPEALQLIPISLAVLKHSAEIRAASSLRLPDAIHVATAKLSACTDFLTEDRRISGTFPFAVRRLAELDALLDNWTAP